MGCVQSADERLEQAPLRKLPRPEHAGVEADGAVSCDGAAYVGFERVEGAGAAYVFEQVTPHTWTSPAQQEVRRAYGPHHWKLVALDPTRRRGEPRRWELVPHSPVPLQGGKVWYGPLGTGAPTPARNEELCDPLGGALPIDDS